MSSYVFTSESVSEGHPDKVCDQISDAILDRFLSEDPYARCAVETLVTTNSVVIAGEVRGPASITKAVMEDVARQTIKKIGYEQEGFHWKDVDVDIKVHKQSVDIAQGVDEGAAKDEGAGDQGLMFGFACRETPVYMPAAIYYSHKILHKLAELRHDGTLSMLGPDAKSQLSLEIQDGKALGTKSIVVSTQHKDGLTQGDVRKIVLPVIEDVLPKGWMCAPDEIYINPTGRFVIGGPVGDAGLTGRKIIVDTYGGSAPHGGGAFSGKDPTKVDRSAAYMARYLAKNVVAADLAERCTIQLSYAIGIAKPISVYVNTHGSSIVKGAALSAVLQELVNLTPRGIRETLQLNRPIYSPTASYGHFGREPTADGHFSWEKLDLVEELKNAFPNARPAGLAKTA